MTRKILHISLSLFLLVITSGFSVSMHYCHGNLVSVKINHEAESCCNSAGCCQNETVIVKYNNESLTSNVLMVPAENSLDLFYSELPVQDVFYTPGPNESEIIETGSPPGDSGKDSHLLFQNFRC